METGPQHEGGANKLEEKEASPCKKQKAEPEGVLTLDMIREAMRAELSKNRDELGQAVATVREEVALFGKRVDSIEAGVTRQMEGTNKVLAIVTANHEKQTEAVQEMKEEQKTQAGHLQALRNSQAEFENRLGLLEGKFRGTSTAAGSTADTDAPKRPALIIGGWPEDQAASETLDKAKAILRQLDVPIDYSEMFVPGLKRGYAIIPIIHKRGETEDQRREDVQNTLQKVRRANVMLGMTAGGLPRKVWMSLSQSPERRRKVRLAGEVKRAVLELGGMAHALEVEFSTGSVWYEKAGAGWIRLDVLARLLGKSAEEVKTGWQPRRDELR